MQPRSVDGRRQESGLLAVTSRPETSSARSPEPRRSSCVDFSYPVATQEPPPPTCGGDTGRTHGRAGQPPPLSRTTANASAWSSCWSSKPNANALTSSFPPTNRPLNASRLAVHVASPSQATSVKAKPRTLTRPARCEAETSTNTWAGDEQVTVPVTVAAPVLGVTLPMGSIVRPISSRGSGGTFGSNASGAVAFWLKSARFATPTRQAPGATAQSTGPLAGVSMRRSTVNSVVNAPVASDSTKSEVLRSQSSIDDGTAVHMAIPSVVSAAKPEPETVTVWKSTRSVSGVTVIIGWALAGDAEATVTAATTPTPAPRQRRRRFKRIIPPLWPPCGPRRGRR